VMKKISLAILLLPIFLWAQPNDTPVRVPIRVGERSIYRVYRMIPEKFGISGIGEADPRGWFNFAYIDTAHGLIVIADSSVARSLNVSGKAIITGDATFSATAKIDGPLRFTDIEPSKFGTGNVGKIDNPVAKLYVENLYINGQKSALYSDSTLTIYCEINYTGPIRFTDMIPSQFGPGDIGKKGNPVRCIYTDSIYVSGLSIAETATHDTTYGLLKHSKFSTNSLGDFDTTGYSEYHSFTDDSVGILYQKNEINQKVRPRKTVPRRGGVVVWHDDARKSDYDNYLPLYNKYNVTGTWNLYSWGNTYDEVRYFGATDSLDMIKRVNAFLTTGQEIGDHGLTHTHELWYNFLDSLKTDMTD
jgi:hypothetical protein